MYGLLRRFQKLPRRDQHNLIQLMTTSAVDLLDRWFETDVLKATMSASGIIGTFLGVRSPGTAYVLLHHYMGEIDGAFRSWGFARGGTGAISEAIASAARAAGVEIRTEAPIERIKVRERPRHRRRARRQRPGDRRGPRRLEPRPAPHVPEADGRAGAARRVPGGRAPVQAPRLVGQGEPRARPGCRTSPACPGTGAHLRGGDLDLARRRVHGARLRRRQVRRLLEAARTSTW